MMERVWGVARDASEQAHGFMHYGSFMDCEAGICTKRRSYLAAPPIEADAMSDPVETAQPLTEAELDHLRYRVAHGLGEQWATVWRDHARLLATIDAAATPPQPTVEADGDGYRVRAWVSHQPSGVVVLAGHPQLGGRYCTTDGGDWPCAAVRDALAHP